MKTTYHTLTTSIVLLAGLAPTAAQARPAAYDGVDCMVGGQQ